MECQNTKIEVIDMARVDSLEARSDNEIEVTDVARARKRRGQNTSVVTDVAQDGRGRDQRRGMVTEMARIDLSLSGTQVVATGRAGIYCDCYARHRGWDVQHDQKALGHITMVGTWWYPRNSDDCSGR